MIISSVFELKVMIQTHISTNMGEFQNIAILYQNFVQMNKNIILD